MSTTAIATPSKTPTPAPVSTVRSLLMDKQGEIAAALPRHIPPAYFLRVVLTAVQKNPQLAQCSSISFLGAVLQCAQLGLVPDGFLGQAYLIPYDNRQKGLKEVQFQAGYRGLITLARRSGDVTNIGAEVVYAKDAFSFTRGINPTIAHTPFAVDDQDAGPLTHVYAWFKLRDGGYDLAVLTRRDVHKIRDRSQAYRQGVKSGRQDSPWFTDEAWMWKKTALKQLLKLAPMSVEIQRAAVLDDVAEVGLPQDLAVLADPTAEATALLEGDTDDPRETDLEMPTRTIDPPPAAAIPTTTTTTTLAIVDRILETGQGTNAWSATTQGGLKLWTRDAGLGQQLIAAKGALRQFTAEPADAQGRRKLIAIAE